MWFKTEPGEPKWRVTGTRYGRPDLDSVLEAVLVRERHPCLVVVGDCKGVDKAVQDWCVAKGLEFLEKRANWNLGRRAGPKKNTALVADSLPAVP
jgi:hypothetical protein